MIVIDQFPPIAAGTEGRAIHIDADRRIVAYTDERGAVAIHAHNGSAHQSIALTREAAEALLVLLATVLEAA